MAVGIPNTSLRAPSAPRGTPRAHPYRHSSERPLWQRGPVPLCCCCCCGSKWPGPALPPRVARPALPPPPPNILGITTSRQRTNTTDTTACCGTDSTMAAAGPTPARPPRSSGAEEERRPGGAVLVPAARRPFTALAQLGALSGRDRGNGSGAALVVVVGTCLCCAPHVTFRAAERSGSGIAVQRVPERWRRCGAMRLWAVVVVAAAALGAVAGQIRALPPISDKVFIRDCVRSHNAYRRNVEPTASNMRHMVGGGLRLCVWGGAVRWPGQKQCRVCSDNITLI